MPNAPKTTLRNIRVDDELWDRFGDLAEPDRSAVIRAFIAWFVREDGAKMPRRPVSRTDDGDQVTGLPPSAT